MQITLMNDCEFAGMRMRCSLVREEVCYYVMLTKKCCLVMFNLSCVYGHVCADLGCETAAEKCFILIF